jgi:hypothetical protein
MKKAIFYSWQSDLPNNTNLGFINTALEKAIEDINSDDNFEMIPFLDRDTIGESGSPDISTTIFDKIDNCNVFICDVSIVNSSCIDARITPNPNVLIELGYAIGKLGWNKIILIMNESYGQVEKLPFDLRGRRVLAYKMTSDSIDKATERKKIASILKNGIIDILLHVNNNNKETKIIDTSIDIEAENAKKKVKAISNITYISSKNKMLEEETKKYIKNNRYDLAVLFAVDITYISTRNMLLQEIANKSIDNSDSVTAEKAINKITYISTKNALSIKLLKIM